MNKTTSVESPADAPQRAAGALADLERALIAANTVEDACRAMEAAIAPLGYNSVDYASGPIRQWPMRDNLDWRPDVIYASHGWQDLYFKTDYQKYDRILPHMLRQVGPWLYWDVWSTPADHPVARELDAMAQRLVASGLSVPFHGPGLRFAGVNLGSSLPRETLEALDAQTRPHIFLMASLLHDRVQQITRDTAVPQSLTPREAECLGWAARGKTAWETGKILSISESAVKKHISSASAKLDARGGAHAIAIALSAGMISI